MHYGKILVKGNACHMDMTGVMANSGFSPMVVKKNGYEVVVPQQGINEEGFIKKAWKTRIDRMTLEDANWIGVRGGEVHLAA